mgnify:CR=1 FL=1
MLPSLLFNTHYVDSPTWPWTCCQQWQNLREWRIAVCTPERQAKGTLWSLRHVTFNVKLSSWLCSLYICAVCRYPIKIMCLRIWTFSAEEYTIIKLLSAFLFSNRDCGELQALTTKVTPKCWNN